MATKFNTKINERPVLSTAKDLLCETINDAVYDHARGLDYKQDLREPYFLAAGVVAKQSFLVSYTSTEGLVKGALKNEY
jgi:hypothetical protein